MKICCLFSLESPHQGDSNKYTQYTISNKKKKKFTLNYPKSAAMEFFSKGLKNKFEIAVINEPSGSGSSPEGLLYYTPWRAHLID